MKAVVLARGLGTRMRQASVPLSAEQAAIAETGVKGLIPVAGRPFLDYALSALADAGVREVCLVIGPEHQAIRQRYLVEARPKRLRVSFATQARPLGTADAVSSARGFTADEEFLVVNSDNYYPVEALSALRGIGEPGTVLFTREGLVRNSNIPAERIAAFGVATIDANGYLGSLVEKPDPEWLAAQTPEPLVSMTCWRLPPAIYDACRDIRPSPRGELELPSAIALAMERGVRFRVLESEKGVLDLSSRTDVGEVAERLRGVEAEL
jgi:glucose-1-phosphate thymidylyltransferase